MKRRSYKRRRFTRGKRITSSTTRSNFAVSAGLRTRKLPLARYRRMLWNQTIARTKYRSCFDATTNFTTPVGILNSTLQVIVPEGAFWTIGGGYQPPDTSTVVPHDFTGDIILRGGIYKLSIQLRNKIITQTATTYGPENDSVRVVCWLVWTNKSPVIPFGAWPTTVASTWSPDLVADFQEYGRVIGRRECLLKTGGEAMEIQYRHKIQKIDQPVHAAGGGRLNVFVVVSQLGSSDATSETVDIVSSHNLTFCADATT